MVDDDTLQEFLEHLADKYYAAEIVELLEEHGIVDVWTILNRLTDEIIEGREYLSE